MYTPRARVYRAQTRFLSLSYGRARREPAELNESSRIDGSGPRGGSSRVSKTDVDDRAKRNEPWPTSVATSPHSSGGRDRDTQDPHESSIQSTPTMRVNVCPWIVIP